MTTPEGSSNPYWSDPSTMGNRLQRVLGIVQRQPDASKIAFLVAKSNNDNFVAYRWDEERASITPFWISTENVSAERRDPLNLAESMLYGISLRVASGGEWIVNMSAEALRDKSFNMVLDEHNNPVILGVVAGKQAALEYAYVQMSKGLVPNVDYVELFGTDMQTGEKLQERIENPT